MSLLTTANIYETEAVLLSMVVEKYQTLCIWKSDYTPTYEICIKDLVNMLHQERLLYSEMLKIKFKTRNTLLFIFIVQRRA